MEAQRTKTNRMPEHNSAGSNANGAMPRRKTTPDKRKRVCLKFFLDKRKDDEKELIDSVKWLKGQRLFTPFIRDGLRLMMDLKARRTDVLFDLFDWLEGWIDVEIERRINARMQDTNARLAKVEAELQAMKMNAPTQRLEAPVAPRPPVPDSDDSDLLTVRKAASDGKSGQRFLDSAFSLLNIQ